MKNPFKLLGGYIGLILVLIYYLSTTYERCTLPAGPCEDYNHLSGLLGISPVNFGLSILWIELGVYLIGGFIIGYLIHLLIILIRSKTQS